MTRPTKKHRTTWKRVLGLIVLVIAVLLMAAWFAWFPSPKEPGYEFVKAWGGKGDSPGRFHDPTGVAVAGREVFVSDARNARIQVFDLGGNFRRQFGTRGKGSGQLGRPMNLTVAKGELFDRGLHAGRHAKKNHRPEG
jgi:hypothetical protein